MGGKFDDSTPGGAELVSDDGVGGSDDGGTEPPADVHVGDASTLHGVWGCVTLNDKVHPMPEQEAQLLNLITGNGLCPDADEGGGGEVPADPTEEALTVWLEVPLATPEPVIEPGWMVVGTPTTHP